MAKPIHPKPDAGKGHKSVNWDHDPEILARLAKVQDAMLEGKSNREIATELGVSDATIRRDIERVSSLLRAQATDDIIFLRQRSLAQARKVQREAWGTWDWMKTASMPKPATAGQPGEQPDEQAFKERPKGRPLSIILEAERMVVDLEGTRTPVDQPVTLKDERTPNQQRSSSELIKRADRLEKLAKELLKKKGEGNQGAENLGG